MVCLDQAQRLSSASGATPQQLLQSPQINNQNNNGIIGDGSNNVVNSGNNNQFNITQVARALAEGDDVELHRLLDCHVSTDALCNSFYSPPECHPNTRTTVRNEISGWIDESESEKSPLLWLNGPAAVGKSVIAKTISGFHNQVVATFFFSTSSNRSATTLFPTLAWQLARRIPDTREHIIASLRNSGSLQATQIEEQFDLLILQPLRSITTLKYRPVMVIDGVDECIDESMLVRFLRVLVRAGEGGSMPVRFIICSRPEPRIRAILGRGHDVNPTVNGEEPQLSSLLHRFLHLAVVPELSRSKHLPHNPIQWFIIFLQDVMVLYRPIRIGVHKDAPSPSDELTAALDRICPHPVISTIKIGLSEESKQDIAIYLTDALNAIPQPGDGTRPWFQSYDISDLVEASCGQFLYASTIVRLLDESHIDPRDVLEMARRGSLPTPDLNKLYKAILKRAEDTIRNQAQDGGPDYQTEWRRVMDSLKMLVFFAGNGHFFTVSKNFPVIESLLGLERDKLTRKLGKMHSVLRIVPGESVEVYHRSFLEFLQSRERSGEYCISHSVALRRILVLVGRAGLRYNTFTNNDSGKSYVQDMVDACRRDFYGRSRFPNVMDPFHLYMHYIILANLPPHMPLKLSVPIFFFGIAASFILSLTIYTFFLHRSVIVPFFHPFLHPSFRLSGGFLVPSRLLLVFIIFLSTSHILV